MNTAEGVSVWVLLYVGDQPSKSSIEIEPIPKNVGALVKALKEELQPDLSHCSAANIEVYQAGTLVMTRTPRTLIDPGNTVPGDTTSKEPLIAFAPAKKEGKGWMLCKGMLCRELLRVFCFAFLQTFLQYRLTRCF